MAPTADELQAAKRRLQPYIAGYPEPMVDARRLRIAQGTASEQDQREIAAENQILHDLRATLKGQEEPPPEVYGDGTTSDDWKARYSMTITLAVRHRTNVDYFSSALPEFTRTLHCAIDQDGVDWNARDVARAIVELHEKWRDKQMHKDAEELLKQYTPQQLLEAAQHLEGKGRQDEPLKPLETPPVLRVPGPRGLISKTFRRIEGKWQEDKTA